MASASQTVASAVASDAEFTTLSAHTISHCRKGLGKYCRIRWREPGCRPCPWRDPKLKGSIIGPSGDWIVARSDGSSVLDLRLLLQTDDAQKIYMACRGIAYTPPGGTLFARILPMFETGAAKYLWLNNIVAVGVYRPMPEKVAYRIFRIL